MASAPPSPPPLPDRRPPAATPDAAEWRSASAPPDLLERHLHEPLPPPPKRLVPPKPFLPYSAQQNGGKETWGAWFKRKGSGWGEKAIVISDNVGTRVNGFSETWLGAERFWPTSNDAPQELAKCTRILQAFTIEGVGFKVTMKNPRTGKKVTKVVKRKIPAKILRKAKGIIIYSAMRNGFPPFGGAGGTGVLLARLEDGSWSPPSFISPNNMTVGLLAGIDMFDSVLVLRSQAAVDAFASMVKVTLGGEIAVAAGVYGGATSLESGVDKTPVLSYVRTRGFYAGIEAMAQVFLCRFDENERVYHWPGISQKDVLTGRVKAPREAEDLFNALEAAESGAAQRAHGAENEFEEDGGLWEESAAIELGVGETLKLPPTPDQLTAEEEEEEWLRQKEERDSKRYLR
ncbi:hypothetical protein JCM10207_001062 [Rhodosporidiobolus poonsookiae]